MKLFLQNIASVGKDIYLFNRLKDGSREIKKITNFLPYYFEKCPENNKTHVGYDGTPLRKYFVPDPSEVKKRRSNNSWESDVLYHKRFIIDNIETISPSKTKWCMFDIEVQAKDEFPRADLAKYPITTIVAYNNYTEEFNEFFIEDLGSEQAIIEHFIKYLNKNSFDAWLIYNGNDFDMPYLINRSKKYNIDFCKETSPIKQTRYGLNNLFYPAGVSIIDYMGFYWKYTLGKKSSYALDNVAQDEFDEDSWGDTDFENDLEHAKEKCLNDVDRMRRIEEEHGLIEFFDETRRFTKCDWEDLVPMKRGYKYQSNNSRPWDMIYLDTAKKMNVCLPKKPDYTDEDKEKFSKDVRYKKDGAYRKLFKTGRFFNNLTQYDISGAYPASVINFCLDKTNLVKHAKMPDYFPSEEEIAEEIERGFDIWRITDWGKYLIENNFIPIPVYYRQPIEELQKDKDYKKNWPEDVKPLRWVLYFKQDPNKIKPKSFERPLKWKKEMKEAISTASDKLKAEKAYASCKSFGNSGFGCSGNIYSRLFCLEEFNANTQLPRDLLQFVEKELNNLGYKMIDIDTDSFKVETSENIVNLLNELVQKWAKEKYGNDHVDIQFEYEGRYINLYQAGNCRYIGDLEKDNGKIERKVRGVEAKRGDSSVYMKKFVKQVYEYLLDETKTEKDIIQYIEKEIKNFKNNNLLDIAFPKKISKPIKEYKTGSYHVKALKNANEEFGLTKKVDEIFYLVYREADNKNLHTIAFDEKTQDLIKDQVDWSVMMEKNIMKKVENIFEACGWDYNSLKDKYLPKKTRKRKKVDKTT